MAKNDKLLGNWNSYRVLKYRYVLMLHGLRMDVTTMNATTEVNPFLISLYVSCLVHHICLDLDTPVLYGETCPEITKLITMKFPSTSWQFPLLSPNILYVK
jgi:hypothetical protein